MGFVPKWYREASEHDRQFYEAFPAIGSDVIEDLCHVEPASISHRDAIIAKRQPSTQIPE
jgi:hypothetical protein